MILIGAAASRPGRAHTATRAPDGALRLLIAQDVTDHIATDARTDVLQLADLETTARPGQQPLDAAEHHAALFAAWGLDLADPVDEVAVRLLHDRKDVMDVGPGIVPALMPAL